jgi:hypothetical protein
MKPSFLLFSTSLFAGLVLIVLLLTKDGAISMAARSSPSPFPSQQSLQTEVASSVSLHIKGPNEGDVHISYPFVATVGKDKPPEEFIWQATDYPTIVHETQAITSSDAFTDTMSFSWETPGEKTISVTAQLAPYGERVSQVYTFPLRTYTISGRVEKVVDTPTSDPDPIEDVWITLSPQVSGVANPVKTDTNGEYTLSNLPAGEYYLTPFKEGYIFSPYVVPVSVPAPSDAKTNFTAYSAIFVDEPQGYPQGVAQNGEPDRIREDQYLVIRLNSTPSTGCYVWVPTRTSQLFTGLNIPTLWQVLFKTRHQQSKFLSIGHLAGELQCLNLRTVVPGKKKLIRMKRPSHSPSRLSVHLRKRWMWFIRQDRLLHQEDTETYRMEITLCPCRSTGVMMLIKVAPT